MWYCGENIWILGFNRPSCRQAGLNSVEQDSHLKKKLARRTLENFAWRKKSLRCSLWKRIIKNEKWKNHVARLDICSIAQLENGNAIGIWISSILYKNTFNDPMTKILDCEKIGKKIHTYFRKQRRNWEQRPQSVQSEFFWRCRFDLFYIEKLGWQTISLGKGNTIQPLGIDASQDYIAVIVDRFHVGNVHFS